MQVLYFKPSHTTKNFIRVYKTLLAEQFLNTIHSNIFHFFKIYFTIIQFKGYFLQVVQINCRRFQTPTPPMPRLSHTPTELLNSNVNWFNIIDCHLCVCVCVHVFFLMPRQPKWA
jgi:hypothetical protein